MHLITFLETAQYSNRILFVWLFHQHLLEATFQRRVFLNELSILVKCGCTHTVKIPPRQRRLQHIARIHGAFGFTGSNHSMQLIDE